jgi:peptidoglycan/LPS O-acetylase OafA/YrhL
MNRSNRGRLFCIDLLRGVAALSVVYFHSMQRVELKPSVAAGNLVTSIERGALFLSGFGRTGVVLFFVISGFCIHLKFASHSTQAGSSSYPPFVSFWKRRFVRLYPPYLICLLLFMLCQLPWLRPTGEAPWAYDIFMHLFMLQNIDPRTVYSIMPVAWTLAVEEQLYLAYFLMLYLRKHLGWASTLTIAFAARVFFFLIAFFVHRVSGMQIPIEFGLAHWFAWVLGAFAVEAYVSNRQLPTWTRSGAVALLFACIAGCQQYALDHKQLSPWLNKTLWLSADAVWAAAFFVLVNCLVEKERMNNLRFGVVGKFLGTVGLFSYSLYLTHDLVIRFGFNAVLMKSFGFAFFVVIPACVLGAFFYYKMVEEWFEKRSRRISY